MWPSSRRMVLLLVLLAAGAACAAAAAQQPPALHPDLRGLLALKNTICNDTAACLDGWTAANGSWVCRSWVGVYCAFVLAEGPRVVGVQLQLDAASVALNDSAMTSSEGRLQHLQYLEELELLCVQPHPPAPPAPAPTPQNSAAGPHRQLMRLLAPLWSWRARSSHSMPRHTAAAAAAAASDLASGLAISRQLSAAARQQQQQHTAQGGSSSSTGVSSSSISRGGSSSSGGSSFGAGELAAAAAAADSPIGQLPGSWFHAFPRLTHLRVVGCGATGVLQELPLPAARHLASLVLSRNRLTGSLPDELAELRKLMVLDLSSNALTGPLPLAWTGLPELQYMFLSRNNLSGTLPCEFAELPLKLADLSGNHWRRDDFLSAAAGGPSSSSSSSLNGISSSFPAAATAAGGSRGGGAQLLRSQLVGASSIGSAAAAAGLQAPTCWLRRWCYDEGAFICLQRRGSHKQPPGSTAGCSSYVYGASDLHVDPSNQCDHGGANLAAILAIFSLFGLVLLLMWLHHCRVVRRMQVLPGGLLGAAGPHRLAVGSSAQGGSGSSHHQLQQQQAAGPWQQRQWLITGPSSANRPRARSRGGSRLVGSSEAAEPLLQHQQHQQQQPSAALPLLYCPPTSAEEGAGYTSPMASAAAPALFDSHAAQQHVGTPDGFFPSALTTPSAGAISIRPQPRAAAAGSGAPTGRLGKGAAGNGRGGAAGARRGGSSNADARQQQQQQQLEADRGGGDGSSTGYESDNDSSSAGGQPGSGRHTVALSGAWLQPGADYYFSGNEPLPPWAGGVARLLAAVTPAAAGAAAEASATANGCFSPGLLLPLVFFLADTITNVRLLLLWGVGPPPHVKLWPSYVLLGFVCLPHLLVGLVTQARLLAAACLPPALKAASGALIAIDSLPPGARLLSSVYAQLFEAPAWLAYPAILLLLAPGVLLLTVLAPLTPGLAICDLASMEAVQRYLQLLQGCAALTQSAGSAGLLTVLYLFGNTPLNWSFLDPALYTCTLCASLANIAAAWWLRLDGARKQQALTLAAIPLATGQQWT